MSGEMKAVTVPVLRDNLQCKITPPWFVDGTEYPLAGGTFDLLICGEAAFGAVHRAIEAAKHSVSIICWGFQPSMYFLRNSLERAEEVPPDKRNPPSIGALLERKAKEGVKVRVLCYAIELSFMVMGKEHKLNPTGRAIGEPNTPGRFRLGDKDHPEHISDVRYAYDKWWYSRYDRDAEMDRQAVNGLKRFFGDEPAHKNLEFRSRGFSAPERAALAIHEYRDKDISRSMLANLSVGPAHHQKMVLVDVESPDEHVGFVMGHNMLDSYWDTPQHPWARVRGHQGRCGGVPHEDFSSRVTGPVVQWLFSNFHAAWTKEGGEMPFLDAGHFKTFQHCYYTSQLGRMDIGKAEMDAAVKDKVIIGHVLRTQPQYEKYDIMKSYLHAVKNATRYIYIENQYFRWPPLADAILDVAAKQTAWGRDPGQHGPLCLFVVTNSGDAGIGVGTKKTHAMLDRLGRADALPEVARTQRIESLDVRIGHAEKAHGQAQKKIGAQREADRQAAQMQPGYGQSDGHRKRWEALTADAQAREAELEALRAERKDLAEGAPILPEERPGLKIHVCTLTSPDTPEGARWNEVYVHSKLMLINDTYMTLGSANINTRSMEVDSELNIAHFSAAITQPARRALWAQHTGGMGAQDDEHAAFKMWREIIDENKKKKDKQTPCAPLCGFLRADPAITDGD